jgi:hypothetical protein
VALDIHTGLSRFDGATGGGFSYDGASTCSGIREPSRTPLLLAIGGVVLAVASVFVFRSIRDQQN